MKTLCYILAPASLLLFGTGSIPAFAQKVDPLRETMNGSRIVGDVEFERMKSNEGRVTTYRFASCVYRRNPDAVIRLLDNSDPMSIDLDAAGLKKGLFKKLSLDECLGNEASSGRAQLRIAPGALHEMMLEPAYLATNPAPPAWLNSPITPVARKFVTTGDKLPQAQIWTEVADCMIQAAPKMADALLRTEVASDQERVVAAGLVPALGGCLYEGQSLDVTPANIRGWAASGLWQAERNRTLEVAKAN